MAKWAYLVIIVPLVLLSLLAWFFDKVESPTRTLVNVLRWMAIIGLMVCAFVFFRWPWYQCVVFPVVIFAGIWLFEMWEKELIERAARRAADLLADHSQRPVH
jgi:hypothetical protein